MTVTMETNVLILFSRMSHHNLKLFSVSHNRWQMMWTMLLLCLLLISIMWWSYFGSVWSWIRLVVWMIALLLLPWRRMTKVLWRQHEIDLFERIIVSFAFSLAVVPLLVFYINLLWVPVTAWLVVCVIIGIIGVCLLLLNKKNEE